MLNLTKESDLDLIVTCVVKFSATWCGPCKMLEPIFIKLETEYPNIKFIAVDVDQIPTLAQKYKIKTVPTLLIFKDGKETERIIGLSPIGPLRKILNNI